MWQKQEEVPPAGLHDLGYPKGDFLITATAIEGPWEDEAKSNILRAGFGINDADTFGKMMSCNNIPALVIGAVDPKRVAKTEEAGNTHMMPMYMNKVYPGEKRVFFERESLIFFQKKAHFLLREYLVMNCASVSFPWVRRLFGIKASLDDEDVFIQKENVKRKCLLNVNNTISTPEGLIFFAGEKVINISAFTGNLGHLKKQGCQWRVLIAVSLSDEDRQRLAEADHATAEKTLDRVEGGLFPLPEGYKRILYAVIPPTAEENTTIEAAFESWKDRRAQKDAARAHAAAGAYAAAPAAPTTVTPSAPSLGGGGDGTVPMEIDQGEEEAQRAAEEAALQAAEEAQQAAAEEAALQAAEEEATRARQAEEEALLVQAAAQEKAIRVQKKRERERPAPSPARSGTPEARSVSDGKPADAKPAPKKKAAPSKNV
jgi:hypothetical protein